MKTLFAMMAGAIFLVASALAVGEDEGRLDISGVGAKVALKPVASSQGCPSFGTWQTPENVNRYLTVNLKGASGKWTAAEISFIPLANGKVELAFLGPAVPGGVKTNVVPLGVCYDNVKVNGALVDNGDLEKGGSGWLLATNPEKTANIPARLVPREKGGNCLLAWHNAHAMKSIEVLKDQQVNVSFEFKPVGEIGPLQPENAFIPLSLATVANMGFTDEQDGDGKGGWTDQGPQNDLRRFNPAQKRFADVPFDIVNPVDNGGRSCVIFKSEHSKFGLSAITIPVGQVCNSFVFLDACAWGAKGPVAKAIAHYADGGTESFDFIQGGNTGGWWNPTAVPDAEIAWRGGNGQAGEVGLYKTVWTLGREAKVDSIEIRPAEGDTVFALVGLTAARLYTDTKFALVGSRFDFVIKDAAEFTAIDIDALKLEMREKGGDPDAFFDPSKYLGKIAVIAPDGKKAESSLVVFKRSISPLLLLKTKGMTGKYTLKIEGDDLPENMLSPHAGLRKMFGVDALPYEIPQLSKDGVLFTSKDFVKSKGIARVAFEDSFFMDAVKFGDAAFIEGELTLEKPMAARLLAYLSDAGKMLAYKHYVWLEILDNKYSTPDFPLGLKIGPHCRHYFYWQGGMVIDIPAGTHKFRIHPSIPLVKDRAELALTFFKFSSDRRVPYTPGLIDELNALKKAGVALYKPESLPAPLSAEKGAEDEFFSIVAPPKSFPDLSYMTERNRGGLLGFFRGEGLVDKRGFMRPDGTAFKYEDGTKVSALWGCNLEHGEIYNSIRKDRLGGDFFDRLMARVKAMGYDTVRHMPPTLPFIPGYNQNQVVFPLLSQKPLKFEDFYLEYVQKLVAACHKQDLHLFYTLWTDNCTFTDLGADRGGNSCIRFFHPEAIERLKQQTRLALATPNPYRNGVAPIHDPTLSIIEIENERNFVEKWTQDRPSDWRLLQADTKAILYGKWAAFLKNKYGSFDTLKKAHGQVALRPGFTEEKGFDAVEFAPVWDVKQWGDDSSDFKMKFDDLRVSSASFGKQRRSSPSVSDGLEFTYRVYRDFIVEMTRFLREDLGYKGVIYANGADTELHYSQRRAISEVGDAVSGGTGYWNREGYGFLRDFNWLAPLAYAANNDKPVISREYGANLPYKNCWWGNLITACAQQYYGTPYLFNYQMGIVNYRLPDYLFPSDSFDRTKPGDMNGMFDLDQDANLYSHFANLASAIALRANNLKPPDFRVDIALPYDNTFYAAPFRGYNRLTIKDYVPYLYAPTCVWCFKDKYDGHANLVVNEPSLPAGDYSAAKNVFLTKPHSSLDRYGKDAQAWMKGKDFKGEGFIDTADETTAFYNAMTQAGYTMPVTRDEMGKVWRSHGRELEIDTNTVTFKADCPDFGAFIGLLDNGKGKMPRQFNATGSGDAWVFMGNYREDGRNAILMAIMDGVVELAPGKPCDYLFLAGGDLEVKRDGKSLVKVLGPRVVDIAVKTKDGEDIAAASELYVTFFRNRSCFTPAKVSLKVGEVKAIEACDRNGDKLGDVAFEVKDGVASFDNPWYDGTRISYFRVVTGN